ARARRAHARGARAGAGPGGAEVCQRRLSPAPLRASGKDSRMSANPTLVTQAHFDYLASRTVQDDSFLVQLKQAAVAQQIPEIQISPAQASFMQILLKAAGAREVIEVGTLAGYSAICMARALPDGGRVRTIELSSKHADFAELWIARSDVARKVQV